MKSNLLNPQFSLHEGDVLGVIDLAKKLDEAPDEIVIFGIQPEKIEWKDALSETLGKRLPDYMRAVEEEIKTSVV